ncbi:8-oxo-dGTP diphosphatase [Motilibacter peucedani]|uniref:8-oxo-dGTP diphosphatase n=1 Tax=Motilibacter peucedani TaxID=598650 RepID=A0A420XTD4_9ACTN|nr:8-oxo-dGTP diphosphatase [Motilibacter peucedani]
MQAAGTVVHRPGPEGPEVLLVHRPRYDDWSFPKGKLDGDEHVVLAAVRETREESGLGVRLERPLRTQRYTVSGRPKEVRYWAATATGGEFTANDEVDEVAWLPVPAARERLTWSRDTTLLDDVERGPLPTTAVVVLRHCRAVPRDDWAADDDLRPLDALGVASAAALAPVLAAYAPRRILCSDTVRTLETVRRLAEQEGIAVEVTPMLGTSAISAAPAAAQAAADAVRSSTEPVLLCTHRQVVRDVLGGLMRTTDEKPPQTTLQPGEFFVLHFAAGVFVALERHSGV